MNGKSRQSCTALLWIPWRGLRRKRVSGFTEGLLSKDLVRVWRVFQKTLVDVFRRGLEQHSGDSSGDMCVYNVH